MSKVSFERTFGFVEENNISETRERLRAAFVDASESNVTPMLCGNVWSLDALPTLLALHEEDQQQIQNAPRRRTTTLRRHFGILDKAGFDRNGALRRYCGTNFVCLFECFSFIRLCFQALSMRETNQCTVISQDVHRNDLCRNVNERSKRRTIYMQRRHVVGGDNDELYSVD